MINPLDISGKNVVVTGASSGIGRETCILLSKLGATLILVGRKIETLQNTQKLLENPEAHALCVADICEGEKLTAELNAIVKKVGMLDGLVHCGGIQMTSPLQFINADSVTLTMQTNVVSAINLARFFRQKNVAKNPSSIVFLSSVTGLFGQSGLSMYAASKGAIISLTRSLAAELSRQKIRVNCVVPGMIDTEMVQKAFENMPLEQVEKWKSAHLFGIGKPKDVAGLIAFLISDMSTWITGSDLVVDGGFSAFKVDTR